MKASQIVENYNLKNNKVDYINNLKSLSQDELINIILKLNNSINNNIGDLIIRLLKDDDYKSASNIEIAAAVQLITGSETSAKSVSSTKSVYNKKVLDAAIAQLPECTGKARILAIAELEYDLIEAGVLIK